MWWYIFISIPHIGYAYIYNYGAKLSSYVPFSLFTFVSIVYRALTYPMTLLYGYQTVFHSWNFQEWQSPLPFFILGTIIVLIGIILNILVYKKIGSRGVYYVCELLNECVRHTGFPYTLMKHPMYYGSMAIALGSAFMFGITKQYEFQTGVWIPMMYVVFLYSFSSYIEEQPPLYLPKYD